MVNLKNIGICLIIFFLMILTGFGNSSQKNSVVKPTETNKQDKFSIIGSVAKVDGNNLLIQVDNQLKLYDLYSKRQIKVIIIPKNQWILGFDIAGDIIAWSDTRNEKRELSTLGGEYNVNSDIFTYNIKTGEQKQITNYMSSQMQPKMWRNFLL